MRDQHKSALFEGEKKLSVFSIASNYRSKASLLEHFLASSVEEVFSRGEECVTLLLLPKYEESHYFIFVGLVRHSIAL
jgi:hypothetical protein